MTPVTTPKAETPEIAELREKAAKYDAINTPELYDFVLAVENEALHQRERWGVKEPPAAPSVEARDAEPWLLLEAAAELEYAATHAPWRPTPQVVSNVLGIARRLRESAARASLLPPETT